MDLPPVFDRFRQELEEELRTVVQERTMPLYQLMAYQLGWVDEVGTPLSLVAGKRVRPVLCLLACEAAGGDYRTAMPTAAAIELVHNFSLIHDDIQDGTPERHHRPSVWWVWGPAQAINAGDGMHALSRLALFRLGERGVAPEKVLEAIGLLDQAALRLCEGQHLDLAYQERLEVGVESYLKMVEGKAGALMGCALELGVLLAREDRHLRETFSAAGRKLGMAFQVRDDVLDLQADADTGKAVAGDILNKKKSLPVIYGLTHAKGSQKRELGAIYFKRVLEPSDARRVAELLEELGAMEYAQKMAHRLCQEALEALDQAGLAPGALTEIREVAEFLVTRRG